jgi:hypothetical protein
VADPDRWAVEPDRGDLTALRRTIGADQVSSNLAPSPARPPVSGIFGPITPVTPATSSLPLTLRPSDKTKMPARSSAASRRPIASPQARECDGVGTASQASAIRVRSKRSATAAISSSTSSLRIWPPVLQPTTWALANIARSSWVRAPSASAERKPKYRTRSASA